VAKTHPLRKKQIRAVLIISIFVVHLPNFLLPSSYPQPSAITYALSFQEEAGSPFKIKLIGSRLEARGTWPAGRFATSQEEENGEYHGWRNFETFFWKLTAQLKSLETFTALCCVKAFQIQ
jgi:hypothetical protein